VFWCFQTFHTRAPSACMAVDLQSDSGDERGIRQFEEAGGDLLRALVLADRLGHDNSVRNG